MKKQKLEVVHLETTIKDGRERRVFTVDVGNLPPGKLEEIVNKIKNRKKI